MGLIRFLLAISVLIAHSHPIFGLKLLGGDRAVQAFYIISGFYMAFILNEKYIGKNGSYKLFITNRLLRLYPVYWIVLVLSIMVAAATFFHTNGADFGKLQPYSAYATSMDPISLAFLVFTNLFMVFQDTIMFLGLDVTTGHLFMTSNFRLTDPPLYSFLLVPQAWTIGLEIVFYLIVPYLARKKWWVIGILMAISILLRILLYQNGLKNDPWNYRFFPTELAFFLLGVLSYFFYTKIRTKDTKRIYLYTVFGLIVCLSLLFDLISLHGKSYLYLVLFSVCIPFIFKLSKKWTFDRYLGELSYPIYISHLLVQTVLIQLDCEDFGIGKGLTLAAATVVFSILLNELVMKRLELVRQARLR
jgi:peptidoglycan/LPS O-acetylase OafA/YrhL